MFKAVPLPEFHFTRSNPDGPVKVLNDKSYLMGEYNQSTGHVAWQRVVLASQKDHIENWLLAHYPIPETAINSSLSTRPLVPFLGRGPKPGRPKKHATQ